MIIFLCGKAMGDVKKSSAVILSNWLQGIILEVKSTNMDMWNV